MVKKTVCAVLIGAVAGSVGCFRDARLLATNRDGGGDGGGTWTPFGPPRLVPGVRSDVDDVQDPALTGDELELYFTSPTGGINDVWIARRATTADPWDGGALVTELASPQNDEDPHVSEDGLVMYLSSDRAGDGMRLYVSERQARDGPWGPPRPVEGLGPSVLDRAPTLDTAGVVLVFAGQRGAAAVTHLHAAARASGASSWEAATELGAINSDWQDTDPALFASGRALVFASRRTGQGRTSDLYQTARADTSAPFARTPEPVDELNSELSEGDPWLSQDGRHLLFSSDRDGRSRLYEAWR